MLGIVLLVISIRSIMVCNEIKNAPTIEAVVTDVKVVKIKGKQGGRESCLRRGWVTYVVNGKRYESELAGGCGYNVGDRILVSCDESNPYVVADPNAETGNMWLLIAVSVSMLLMGISFFLP